LPSSNSRVSVTLKMPRRASKARTWAVSKSLLSGVREVEDSTPRTAADPHRAVPIASAITVRRSDILPVTAEAEGDLVLVLTSVAPVKAATVRDLAQAATTDAAAVVVDALPVADAHHLAMEAVTTGSIATTATETTPKDVWKADKEKSAKEDRAHAAPKEQAAVHPVTSVTSVTSVNPVNPVNREIAAPARSRETARIALREAPLAA